MRAKIIKFMEENVGEKLHDFRFGSILLNMTLSVQATKGELDKLDFINIKIFVPQRKLSTK